MRPAARYRTADISRSTIITRKDPDCLVERTTFAATTRYRIEGTAECVQHEIEKVKRDYPSQGYGTWMQLPRFLEGGRVEVTVDRSNSCE